MFWSLNFTRAYKRLVAISLAVTVCFVCVWLLCGTTGQAAAHSGHTEQAVHGVPERLIMRGDHGWELEIYSGPMPAMVGHVVHLTLWLRKDGEVFPGMTEIAITVTNLEAGQTVAETYLLARQGHTAQSLQIYDGAPHIIAVTVRPVGGEASAWAPPPAVLNVDVVPVHPPLAVQIRMMAILLGVLVVGSVVGFFVPRTYKA